MEKKNKATLPYRGQVREFLEIAKVRKGFTWKRYADLTEQSYQNVYNKLERGSITLAELFLFCDREGIALHLVDKKTGKTLA